MASLSLYIPVFFYMALFVMNLGLSSYYTIEITRLARLVESQEFSFTFGLASSMVIGASAIAGYISPLLFSISPEMNFYTASLATIIALGIIIVNSRRYRSVRAPNPTRHL